MNKITYNLILKGGKEYTFEADIDRQDRTEEANNEIHAFWTKLNCNQCSNCPLQASSHKYCPAALDIEEMVNVHLMKRLQDASNKDANSNALYLFVTLTSLIAMDINGMLEALDPIVRKGL